MTDCPECDKPVRGAKCVCGWTVPLPSPVESRIAHPEQPKPYVRPTGETLQRFKSAMRDFGRKKGQFWVPERVRTQQQVNFILLQADRFGPTSQQGRFLAKCREYGCITADNKLRMREPGEDEMEAA